MANQFCVFTFSDRMVSRVTRMQIVKDGSGHVGVHDTVIVKWPKGKRSDLYDGLVLSIHNTKAEAEKNCIRLASAVKGLGSWERDDLIRMSLSADKAAVHADPAPHIPVVAGTSKSATVTAGTIKATTVVAGTSQATTVTAGTIKATTVVAGTSKAATVMAGTSKATAGTSKAASVTAGTSKAATVMAATSKAATKRAYEQMLQQYTAFPEDEEILNSDDNLSEESYSLTDLAPVPTPQENKKLNTLTVDAKGHPTVAQKQPRIVPTLPSTCNDCQAKDKKILELRKKLADYQKSHDDSALVRPRSGFLPKSVALENKMIELNPGKGLFLYQDDRNGALSHGMKAGLKRKHGFRDGPAMARYLMNRIWSKQELLNGSLKQNENSELQQLDPSVVEQIVDFSVVHGKENRGVVRNAMWSKLTGGRSKQKTKALQTVLL